jgi:glycosyltransferase involved in cell wall biosynthesis
MHSAAELNEKLWGGFSRSALRHLEHLRCSPLAPVEERSEAAWHLARWHMYQRNFNLVLEYVEFMRKLDPQKRASKGLVLLEVDCLLRLNDAQSARTRLDEALLHRKGNIDLTLAYANTYAPAAGAGTAAEEALRLKWINRVYKKIGLSPVVKADPGQTLTIKNLAATLTNKPTLAHNSKVSIILPTYRAQATLPFALGGLLAQTWQNLEIIVVDDCSPDETFAIAEEFRRQDDRIVVMRQPWNQGAYAARNRGLETASGDLITTHDADDWSHPEKLELQVSSLLSNPRALANHTDWARVRTDIRFTGAIRPTQTLVQKDLSSTLYRREVFDRLGGWDNVRVAADDEFMWRVRRYGGPGSIDRIMKGVPLAFSLDSELSLTRVGPTHVRTVFFGVRREYGEAAFHWHASSPLDTLRLNANSGSRAFPAPGIILPQAIEQIDCDLLLVADFSLHSTTLASATNYVKAAVAGLKSLALFHWARFDLGSPSRISPELRQMAQEGRVTIVAPGEKVRSRITMIIGPAILAHAIDLCPKIDFDHLILVVDAEAVLRSEAKKEYNPRNVREHLQEFFGTEGTWIAESEPVKKSMEADRNYPRPYAGVWMPLVDIAIWRDKPLTWRSDEGQTPVIGCLGGADPWDWPTNPDEIRAVYCADERCTVEIIGDSSVPLSLLGACPNNWVTRRQGSIDLGTWLSRLDFFIYYPRQDRAMALGLMLEAMAAGCPVILPPTLQSPFGSAALYAKPAEVWEMIEKLWQNRDAYLKRALMGRDFVLSRCNFGQLAMRLQGFGGARRADLPNLCSHE